MSSVSGVGGVGGVGGGGFSLPLMEGVKGSSEFDRILTKAVDGVDGTLKDSDAVAKNFAAGKVENPHEVMIRLEEANLTLQWTLQVRNKVVDAYNEMMRMSV
jgi:flagellar hook-basal body complex protein FliE